MSLRFHWMLPKGGELGDRETARVLTDRETSLAAVPDMEAWSRFGRQAETSGIESVLMSFSNYEPDTLVAACAIGAECRQLKFIAAYRLGLMKPATFVQQVNTLSGLIDGRIAINVVAGSSLAEQRGYGDFLEHDERYARAEEFLAICHAFWRNGARENGAQENSAVDFDGHYYQVAGGNLHTPFQSPDRSSPEIYVAGHSQQAERLALSQGSCWLRLADTPEALRPLVTRTRDRGVEVCLRLCIVCRPTREEAIRAAKALRSDRESVQRVRKFLAGSDSKVLRGALNAAEDDAWLGGCLWAGLVPSYGSSAITLVGTPEELAEAFLEYGRIGVTQFIVAGWPKLEEMVIFGREVLPLIRGAQ